MAQVGLHAYLALKLKDRIPRKKWILFSFILGSIIPDLDIAVTAAYSLFMPISDSLELTHRTFSHSIFLFIVIYLLFLIIYEATKKTKFLLIGNGLIMGFTAHLIVDIFFWFE